MDEDLLRLALALPLRTLLYFGLLVLLFAPLEALAPRRKNRRSIDSTRTDVLFGTLGSLLSRAFALGLGALLLALSERLGPRPLAAAPPALAIPFGLLVFELGSYAYHRAAHACGPLWRLHAVHHSSTSFDLWAGFRQHPLEIALMTAAQNLPLVLLGLSLGEHALLVALLQINTLWVHANVRLPERFETHLSRLIATPRFHARHHATHEPSANYATLFPLFDRLGGTFAADTSEAFGLPASEALQPSFVGLLLLRRRASHDEAPAQGATRRMKTAPAPNTDSSLSSPSTPVAPLSSPTALIASALPERAS